MRWKIAQLRDSGIDIVRVLSTDEAMNTLNNKVSFGAIISDMGRREQGAYRSQAGLVLLNAIKRAGYTLPFLVYTSQKYAARNDAEVKAAGGDGATASAVELLEWVNRNIKTQS